MAARTMAPKEELQNVLEKLHPGDEIALAHASRATGLDEETCATVFEALVRVGLFTRGSHGVFVRRGMFDALERRLHL